MTGSPEPLRALRPERLAAVARETIWPLRFLFAQRGYARLWSVTLLSGSSGYLARGAIYVWVAQQWPLVQAAATLVLAEGAAAVLAAPLAGRVIERIGPRASVVMADLVRCAALAAACLVPGWYVACVALFAVAVFGVLHQAARDAAVGEVVARSELSRASGLDQVAGNLALALGPLLGTLLTLQAGIAAALSVAAAGHLLAAVLARGLPRVGAAAPDAGIAPLVRRRGVPSAHTLAMLILFWLSVVGAGLWLAAAPALLAGLTSAAAPHYGFQIAAAGAAALAGGVLAPALVERWGAWRVLGAAAVAEALGMLVYALSGSLAVMSLSVVAVGFAAATMGTAFYTQMQRDTEPSLRGRTFALVRQLDAGGILAAGLLGLGLAAVVAPQAMLAAAAIMYLMLGLCCLAAAAPGAARPPWRHAAATLATLTIYGAAFAVTWPAVRLLRGRAAAHAHAGRRLARLCEALGPTYMKLGQVLSVRPDLLPPEVIEPLRRLQENVAPLAFADVDAVLRYAYGERYAETLAVDPVPVAAAAIAQVHRAIDRSGRALALKVRRPDVSRRMHDDLALMQRCAAWLARRCASRDMPVRELAAEIAAVLANQLDFAREAGNNRRFRANFARVEGVRFPALAEEFCTGEIIAMEFMEDRQRVDAQELPEAARRRAALAGLRALYKMIFDDGFVHADLHAGNFFVSRHGGVILLDTGLVADVPEDTRRDFVDFFFAVANDDGTAAAEVIWRGALARPPDERRGAFESDMRAFVARHSRLTSGAFEVTRFVHELLEIQRRHGLRASPAFVTIVLAMIVYDGVCKTLYPDLDFQAEARGPLIAARYGRERRGGRLMT